MAIVISFVKFDRLDGAIKRGADERVTLDGAAVYGAEYLLRLIGANVFRPLFEVYLCLVSLPSLFAPRAGVPAAQIRTCEQVAESILQ